MPKLGSPARTSPHLLGLMGLTVALSACDNGTKGSGSNIGVITVPDDTEEAPPTLQLSVDATEVVAGGPVPWSLTLLYEDGDVEETTGTIVSDLEALHFGPGGDMLPRVAGQHTLTASAEVDGELQTLTAELTVLVGATAEVDLVVSDQAFAAGGSVDWSILAWDEFGNVIDTGSAVPDLGAAPLNLDGSAIRGTVPGAYTVDAMVEGVMDSEVVVVVPGGPASVELSLSDTALELYETTSASVVIVDSYGNPVSADWTLSVTGTDVETEDYALSWNNVTFYSEGAFTVRVDVDGTALYDEVGPLLIDSTGPDIILDSPDRGAWNEGLTGTVSGTVEDAYSGISSLTIDGTAVTVASDGTFSQDTTWNFGTNVVETEAYDGDGNRSTDTRSVLAGDFLTWGDEVDSGFIVRLAEGSGGLGTLEVLAEELVTELDLDSLIPSPVFSDSEETCVTIPLVGRRCFTWYSLTLYVGNSSFGDVDLYLNPKLGGVLEATFTVEDIYLQWTANAVVAEIGYNGSGDITADDIQVTMLFKPTVDGSGNIDLGLQTVSASTSNFYFDWDSWLYDALDFFGIDSSISGLIQGYIEDTLESTVEDMVPELLGDALQDLEIAFDLPLNGVTYAIDAVPSDIQVLPTYIRLDLATTVVPDTWVKSDYGLGSLYADYDVSTWPSSVGTHLGMNLDFLNQFFMAAWGGGLLDMELDSSALGLDVSDLEFLLPGLTDLTITTEALLPPVVVPDGVDAMLELQVGDLLLTLYNGEATAGNEMIQVYVTVFVEMDIDANSTGTSLTPELGDMELYFDVVVPEANSLGASDTEALLQLLVPLLLPTLTDALTEIPIPDIQGFGVSGVSVDTLGTDDGVVAIGGNLVVR